MLRRESTSASRQRSPSSFDWSSANPDWSGPTRSISATSTAASGPPG